MFWVSLLQFGRDVDLALYFDVPGEVMKERCLKRGESSGRSDDNAETIVKRVDTFFEKTQPVVDVSGRFAAGKRECCDQFQCRCVYLQLLFHQFPSTHTHTHTHAHTCTHTRARTHNMSPSLSLLNFVVCCCQHYEGISLLKRVSKGCFENEGRT